MRPNIVFITSHDLGRHLGCYGIDSVNTPELDRLAVEGVRFTRSFCTAPQCCPSRAAMCTGRYPHSNGVLGLTHGAFAWDLHPAERHLAMELGSVGYHTAVIGVHHEARDAARCGFHELAVGEQPARAVAARCEKFLLQQQDSPRPFYLQLGFFEPHRKFDFGGAEPDVSRGISLPAYLRNEPAARAEFGAFQGAIRQLDTAIGRVLSALDRLGLAENTLVLFTADHGIPFPRAKCTLYDPGLEAALLLRWPRRGWNGGRTVDDLVSNLDYFPTILEAGGVQSGPAVQGRSFAARLDGDSYRPRGEIFAEMTYHQYYDPLRCIRTDRHKLICCFASGPSFMNPTQTYRPAAITVVPKAPEHSLHADVELYDLANDPHEFLNLAEDAAHQKTRTELLGRLHAWMIGTDDSLLSGVPVCPQHTRVMRALADASAKSNLVPAQVPSGHG